MMRDRLAEAIRLRETGRTKQDQAMLEEARTLVLDRAAAYPDDTEITYQAAVVLIIWELSERPFHSISKP